MAKSQQTFRKRQRERMLREKAEMKRARREQRRLEKKPFEDDLAAPPADESYAQSEPASQTVDPLNN